MDIALVSNPTNSTETASIQLVRLSGSNNNDYNDEDSQDPSRVWATTLEKKAVLHDLRNGSSSSNKDAVPSTQDVWLQPRLPESLAWSDDGQMFAFAASTSDLKIYSVHDGKPLVHNVPIPSSEPETPLYLLSWQECLSSPLLRDRKEVSTAEELEYSLPRLPDVKPSSTSAKNDKNKANVFVNPFLPGGLANKPFIPSVVFKKPPFPTLANAHPLSPTVPSAHLGADLSDDPETIAEDALDREKTHYSPTLLLAGDEKGNLHLLMGGAIGMGCIALLGEHKGEGEVVDIISAYVHGTDTEKPTPFRHRHRHTLKISLLVSVPLDTDTSSPTLPAPIKECIEAARPHPPPRSSAGLKASSSRSKSLPPPVAPAETSKSLVMRLQLHLPKFPSVPLTQLARASSGINLLLTNLFEILDDARKSYEEMLEVKKKWLDRLKDDDGSKMRVDLQLCTLLLSGRPANKNMHEYLASKNTERNLDRWESIHATAMTKLRNLSYRNLTPACECLLLWITQIIGWGKLWNADPSSPVGGGNGGIDIQIDEFEKCAELVKVIMHNAEKLEGLVLEEQLGFRDFSGWVRYELERLSAIEAQASARPTPKHDVLAVMTYLKTKLLSNPLDGMLKVEDEKDVLSRERGYIEGVERWLSRMVEVNKGEYMKKDGEEKLPVVLEKLKAMLRTGEDHEDEPAMQAEAEMHTANTYNGEMEPFQLDCERMYTDPSALLPPPPIQSIPLTATPSATNRRKSAIAPRTPAPPPPPPRNTDFNPTTLPLPAALQILSSKLSKTLHYSFSRITSSSASLDSQAKIVKAKNVILWQVPDRQEDDSMTALGLARDPTKISSRLIRNIGEDGHEEGASQHWIACETAPGVLSAETQQGAFWLTMLDDDDQVRAAAFALVQEDGTPLEILDVDFFDDIEVALLIRIPQTQGQPLRYALATVRYRDVTLTDIPGPLNQSLLPRLEPIPFHRYHAFESGFEPLQFSLNGRKGRRIGCVLGNLGRVLEVLDLDDEEPEEEEAGDGEETARDEEDMQEPQEEFLDDQGGMYQDDNDDAHSFRDGSMLNGQDEDEDPMAGEEQEEDDMDL